MHNFYAQVSGRKRFILIPAKHYFDLLVFPSIHPTARMSQIDINNQTHLDTFADRLARLDGVQEVILEAGDVLCEWFVDCWLPASVLNQFVRHSSVALSLRRGGWRRAVVERQHAQVTMANHTRNCALIHIFHSDTVEARLREQLLPVVDQLITAYAPSGDLRSGLGAFGLVARGFVTRGRKQLVEQCLASHWHRVAMQLDAPNAVGLLERLDSARQTFEAQSGGQWSANTLAASVPETKRAVLQRFARTLRQTMDDFGGDNLVDMTRTVFQVS